MKKNQAFTLIEVMIVVAIVIILAAISYPAYQDSVRKSKRAEVKTTMLEIAQRLQRYKIENFNFRPLFENVEKPITLADLNVGERFPEQGEPLYTLSLIDVTASSWTLVAMPLDGLMKLNGVICLNSKHQKFWKQGESKCKLNDQSNW